MKIHLISPIELQKWLNNGEAIIIDVREPAEYKSESIDGALHLPLSQVEIDAEILPKNPNKKIVMQCQSGRRSMMACEKLKGQNYPGDIWNLEGGIFAWKSNDFPVKSGIKKIIPIDRQVHVIIGSGIVIGTLLGVMNHQIWFILPLIFGLGLFNSGVTGWCGLGKLIAKMPWNR